MKTRIHTIDSKYLGKNPRTSIDKKMKQGGGWGDGEYPEAEPRVEVRVRVFGWFSGPYATFGLDPTTVWWF